MRRDKISIRYRQVSILRRWSITLSRHQLLRDEHCFIFCYRLNVANSLSEQASQPNDNYCESRQRNRERERERTTERERAKHRELMWRIKRMNNERECETNSSTVTSTCGSFVLFAFSLSAANKCLALSLWRTLVHSLHYGIWTIISTDEHIYIYM